MGSQTKTLETSAVKFTSRYFSGSGSTLAYQVGSENNEILFVVTKLLQKYIWDCKLRKTLPVLRDIQLIVLDEFVIFKKISLKFSSILENSTLNMLK